MNQRLVVAIFQNNASDFDLTLEQAKKESRTFFLKSANATDVCSIHLYDLFLIAVSLERVEIVSRILREYPTFTEENLCEEVYEMLSSAGRGCCPDEILETILPCLVASDLKSATENFPCFTEKYLYAITRIFYFLSREDGVQVLRQVGFSEKSIAEVCENYC